MDHQSCDDKRKTQAGKYWLMLIITFFYGSVARFFQHKFFSVHSSPTHEFESVSLYHQKDVYESIVLQKFGCWCVPQQRVVVADISSNSTRFFDLRVFLRAKNYLALILKQNWSRCERFELIGALFIFLNYKKQIIFITFDYNLIKI